MPERLQAIVVPPDGGWGWIVVIVSFISNFYEDGIITAFGLFMGEIALDFGCEQSQVTIGSSVLTGLLYILGPIICALINRYGLRFVAVLGGFLAGIAMATTSFTPNVTLFIISYGLFCGVGFCMTYMTNIICVGFYFQKKRAVALSIAVCGSSIGTLVTPVILSYMEHFTWRRKFQILSCGGVVVGVLGLAFKPIQPTIIVATEKATTSTEPTEKPSFFRNNTRALLTAKQHVGEKYTVLGGPGTDLESHSSFNTTQSMSFRSYKPMSASYMSTRFEVLDNQINLDNRCKLCCYKCRRPNEAKPMYRDDIFFLGPTEKMTDLNLAFSDSEYFQKLVDINLSLTRVPSDNDILQEHTCCVCCPTSIKRMLSTMCDCHLLSSVPFFLLALSGFMIFLGYYVPYTYCYEFAVSEGMEHGLAVYLVSTLGISNTLGRFLSGTMTLIPKMDPTIVFSSWIFLAGTSIILMPFFTHTIAVFTLHASYGFFVSSLASLRPLVASQMVGLENLTNAFGIMLLFAGISALGALPLAGKLTEITGHYTAGFISAGSFLVFGAVLMIPMKRLGRWENDKRERKSREAKAASDARTKPRVFKN